MATRLIAIAIVALTLIPFANWLPGGETDPEYAARTIDWLLGLILCVGVGGFVAYLTYLRGRDRTESPPTPSPLSADPIGGAGSRFAWGVAVVAGGLYALIAHLVFSGSPLLIDEIIQVIQARWYAEGRLWIPTPDHPEFSSLFNLVEHDGRTFGHFPFGGPAMLALGSLVGAEWLVGPVAGALSVRLFAALLTSLEPTASRRWHRGTVILFALAPFGVFMFGSHMNHATALCWLLLAWVGIDRATGDAGRSLRRGWALLAGLGLGMVATIRPLDGVAFALPTGVWLAWRARRGGQPLRTLLLVGAGMVGPIALLLWINQQTTGAPLLFGYDLLWGANQRPGFHPAPWGPPHTPTRGVELISLGVTRLSIFLFETPFPALLPAAVALWGRRRLTAMDRLLLAGGGALVLAYWAYWHDGFYLGPRFFFPLLPVAVLWSARVVMEVERWGQRSVHLRRVGFTTLGVGAVYAVVTIAMVRLPQYRHQFPSLRFDITHAAAAKGIDGAVVLVQEGWGAQLLARLWAIGVPRPMAEALYRTTDVCQLDDRVRGLEAKGVRGEAAVRDLHPLQRDSLRLVPNPYSPDRTLRVLPDVAHPPSCVQGLLRDREGVVHLAVAKLAEGNNVYLRWFPGRERTAVGAFPDRPVYLLDRVDGSIDAPLRWQRIFFE